MSEVDLRQLSHHTLGMLVRIFDRFFSKEEQNNRLRMKKTWQSWLDNCFIEVSDKKKNKNGGPSTDDGNSKGSSLFDVVNIFQNSERGKRSKEEITILRRFLTSTIVAIPWKDIKGPELDILANEIDWQPVQGTSIVFLQGDFGNVYYMIGSGTVALYLEKSKDREMTIAREYGEHRIKQFPGSDEELANLGSKITTLPAGIGFGEVAILSKNHKFRSCAAVSMGRQTLLLVVHASTYNKVLRKVHMRQQQMSSAMELLTGLPIFKGYQYPTIATIAFEMNHKYLSQKEHIVITGQKVDYVYFIINGTVKKKPGPPPKEEEGEGGWSKAEVLPIHSKAIPQLGVTLLGRGGIIGEMEVFQHSETFRHTYVAESAVEIFQLPVALFLKTLSKKEGGASGGGGGEEVTTGATADVSLSTHQEIGLEREREHESRLLRAKETAAALFGLNEAQNAKKLVELGNLLPSLLGGVSGGGDVMMQQTIMSALNDEGRGGREGGKGGSSPVSPRSKSTIIRQSSKAKVIATPASPRSPRSPSHSKLEPTRSIHVPFELGDFASSISSANLPRSGGKMAVAAGAETWGGAGMRLGQGSIHNMIPVLASSFPPPSSQNPSFSSPRKKLDF